MASKPLKQILVDAEICTSFAEVRRLASNGKISQSGQIITDTEETVFASFGPLRIGSRELPSVEWKLESPNQAEETRTTP